MRAEKRIGVLALKILYITTVGGTMVFFKSLIKSLIEEGHTVDVAANELAGRSPVPEFYKDLGCRVFQLPHTRKPLNKSNLRSIKIIRELVEREKYDVVHCHTPIAAACTRLACRKLRKNGLKVYYTAHGFHFYKGAPLKNWIIYYPIEKICSYWTDVLITINREDCQRAQKKFHAGQIAYVPGVGVDLSRFEKPDPSQTAQIREELHLPSDAILLVSVGELNENKNQSVVIKAIAEIPDPRIHYALAGKGFKQDDLHALAESLHVGDRVHLLGYRRDVPTLYAAADICVFPSIREGQGIAAIEGMAAGLPLIASDNRGTRDFLTEKNALICPYYDVHAFADAIRRLADDAELRARMGSENLALCRQFDVSVINETMRALYQNAQS